MRPLLHFTSPSGWINDPHGITFRGGRYEVFYQFVPDSTVWGPNCHWGHAVGDDLLSLTVGPVALAPGEGDDGIWTGCIVTGDDGGARLFYTATSIPEFGIGRIRVARPVDDGWQQWVKGEVVCTAPDGLELIAFRDPFVRRTADGWHMFVGAAGADGTAMALVYRSADLDAWEYAGVAMSRSTQETDPVWMGALWECPQIFTLDGSDVMVSSVWDADVLHYAGYALGTYEGTTFDADMWGRLTFGDSYYAPSLFEDAQGRACLSLWMRGIEDVEEGWAGAHSVPHLLAVEDGRLVAAPHPDVALHRGDEAADGRVAGLAADIEWTAIDGAVLEIASGGTVAASIAYRDGEIVVTTDAGEHTVPAESDLRVIVDGPVLEVSSPAGIYGAAISPAGEDLEVAASAGDARTFPLH